MAEFARGADLFLVESTLRDTSHDDPRRGHLMPEEAIEMAHQAEARSTLLVHYLPARRHEIEDDVRRAWTVDPAGRGRAGQDGPARDPGRRGRRHARGTARVS